MVKEMLKVRNDNKEVLKEAKDEEEFERKKAELKQEMRECISLEYGSI